MWNTTQFQMKGFALGLVFKQRRKATWKWPVEVHYKIIPLLKCTQRIRVYWKPNFDKKVSLTPLYWNIISREFWGEVIFTSSKFVTVSNGIFSSSSIACLMVISTLSINFWKASGTCWKQANKQTNKQTNKKWACFKTHSISMNRCAVMLYHHCICKPGSIMHTHTKNTAQLTVYSWALPV